MSLQLPPAALRQLEQTLAQWRQWRDASDIPGAPHLVAQLGGISNHTVLAEAAGQRFCVRLDGVNPAANGLNRQVEWRALHSAHAAGLAPRPRYFNPEIGTLVCDYLPPDDDQSISPQDLALLLRGIHRLPGLHFRLDLRERIRRYQRQLGEHPAGIPAGLDPAIAALLEELDDGAGTSRLCHNDLSRANLVRSAGKLYALDWEYCAMGDRWFDLATGIYNSELEPEQGESLLEHYLQRPLRDADRARLDKWLCVAGYLELLWYLTQRPDCLEQDVIQRRTGELTVRLDRLNRGSY